MMWRLVLREMEPMPAGYGIAYVEPNCERIVVCPIPLNWLVALWWRVSLWLKRGPIASDPISLAWRLGYDAGRGADHVDEGRLREQIRTELRGEVAQAFARELLEVLKR